MSVPVDPRSERDGYEHHDARVRNLLFIGVAILLAMLASCAAVAGLVWYLDSQQQTYVTPVEASDQVPPKPRLEAHPSANGARVVAEARQSLLHYGWVDRDAGLARIPVERAMSILADSGWPSAQRSAVEAGPPQTETHRRATR